MGGEQVQRQRKKEWREGEEEEGRRRRGKAGSKIEGGRGGRQAGVGSLCARSHRCRVRGGTGPPHRNIATTGYSMVAPAGEPNAFRAAMAPFRAVAQ
eukprot:756107-Hanusia_phi.AAC.2